MVEKYKKILDSPGVWSLKSSMAQAMRAADYYGIAGSSNARFSARLPDWPDIFFTHCAPCWATAKAEDVVAFNSAGVRLEAVGDFDSKVAAAHIGMHAVSGKDWVLHVYSHHVIESVARGVNDICDTLAKLSRRDDERVVQSHGYGRAWHSEEKGEALYSKEGTKILLLAQSGIGVCANTLKYAFDDLYHLERSFLANHLLQASNVAPAVVSGQLSLLLCAQYDVDRAFSWLSKGLPQATEF